MKRPALIVALALAVSCTSGGSDDPAPSVRPTSVGGYVWQPSDGLPTPRTEVAVTAVGAQIFVAGGFTADGAASAVVEVFDASEGRWGRSRLPQLPEPLHHTAMVSYHGRLFVFGGYREDGSASSTVWALLPYRTPADDAPGPGVWERRPDMPTARGAHAAVLIDAAVHVIGGASRFGGSAKLVGAHDVYDLEREAWTTIGELPEPRDHLAAAAIGPELYVVGGRELSLARNSGRLDLFDTQTRRWTRRADMPTPRGGIAAATLEDRLVVFGGEQPSGTFDETEIYDPRAGAWTSGPTMPTARHGLGATTVPGRGIAVVAGGREPGLSVSDAIEFLVRDDRVG